MAVLMSYHKLVERDSKHVDYCWKGIAIFLLVLAVVSCFIGSLSLQKLIITYDTHCVLGADLKFSLKPITTKELITNSSSYASAETKSFTLSEFFTPEFASRLGFFDDQEYPAEELNFLDAYQIDDKESNWGKYTTCDFAIFIPVFQLCFGIIFIVMFIICGKGGRAEQNSFLPQPWRIVTPSMIFFLIMMCISITNLTTIQTGLNAFCQGFLSHTPDVGCLVSMNNFAINKDSVVLPSVLYILLLTFSWILLVCWVVLFLTMIARIIFVIDFQLVRVTIRTCEAEQHDKTDYQVIEPQEEDKEDGNV